MRTAFIARLVELAKQDPKVFLITADLGFGVLSEFSQTFTSQFLNVGVAEQNMMAVACGIALEGRTVYAYSIGNFPTLRCLEQIRNDICYHGADVKIICVGAGFSYGQLGISHHATEDIAVLRALPEMTILSPSDEWEAGEAAVAVHNRRGPAYVRLDKSVSGVFPRSRERFVLGRARVLREGTDITLIGTGGVLKEALKAADLLAQDGIMSRVISMHTIKPLDRMAVEAAARETGGIVTVEEHTVIGGLGSAVAEVCLETSNRPQVFERIGLMDTYSSIVGDQLYLRRQYGMDASAIADRVRAKLRSSVPMLAPV